MRRRIKMEKNAMRTQLGLRSAGVIMRGRSRGLTLTELLVVMLIIGLLSTIAVPVYINRMEDARVRLALGETREIAHAEMQCGIIHGFYVPFQVLDDIAQERNTSSIYDTIRRENSSIKVVNPLLRADTQQGSQLGLTDYGNNPRITSMVDNWEGPFLNPQRVYVRDGSEGRPGDNAYPSASYYQWDFPLDPWGIPYRFYSPLGIIGSAAFTNDYSNLSTSFSDGVLTSTDNKNFDRYAIISYGRDGLSQQSAGAGNERDDIVYMFGSNGVESTFGLRY